MCQKEHENTRRDEGKKTVTKLEINVKHKTEKQKQKQKKSPQFIIHIRMQNILIYWGKQKKMSHSHSA